jgi:hypothetical protein
MRAGNADRTIDARRRRPSHTSATKRREGARLWTGTAEEFGADCVCRQSIAADLPGSIRHADRVPTV